MKPNNDLEKVLALKRRLIDIEREQARAAGTIEQLEKQLKELGYPSLKAATAAIPKLEKEALELEREYREAEAEYEKKWSGK